MAQYLRPTSDITTGSWSPSTGTTLYGVLDEATRADADYISSAANQLTLCEVGLGSGTDPEVSTGHIVRYTYLRTITNKNYTLVVRLMQGTTTIASWTHANPSTSFTLAQQTLTGTQADSITDYTNLRLQFEVTVAAGGGGQMQVSWAELEIPGTTTVTGGGALDGSGDIAGSGLVEAFGAGALDGSGDIAATGSAFDPLWQGEAALDGSGDVAGDATTEAFGAGALAGEGLLGATGLGIALGAAAMVGEGDVTGSHDVYLATVSSDAPDVWWRFTETSGTTADDYVGTNDLTVTGANLDVTGAARTGSAVSFDGTDDEAESGSSLGWDGAHSLTVEAWLKASSWTTASATPDSVFLLWVDESGNLAFQVRDSADTTWAVASTTVPSTGAWHHVVGVWDRTQQKALLYVNGSLANSSAAQSFTDIGALSEVVQVGTDGGTVFTAFELDELAIYNEALSSARISAHYTAGSASTTVNGAAALAGEGDVAGAGLVEAFGAAALDGSGDLAGSGVSAAFGAGALDGSADLAGSGLVEALAQGALDGEGALVGSGLTTALGASEPAGNGVIDATGTTESFGAADLAGEGNITGNASATFLGEAALSGEGVITADGETIALGAGALDGAGDVAGAGEATALAIGDLMGEGAIAGSGVTESFGAAAVDGSGDLAGEATTESYGASALLGEGVITADGDGIAVGAGALDGSGDVAGAAFTESFGAADLDGAGNLYGSAGDVQQGEGVLLGEGLLDGAGLTLSYSDATISGEGVVGATGQTVAFGGAALDGAGDIAGAGTAEALAAADLTGEGDLYGQSSAGAVTGAVSFSGSGDVDATAVTTAFGVIVCSAPVVTWNGEPVTFGGVTVYWGGDDCRYIYGEGDLYAEGEAVRGVQGRLVGEGLLGATGTTTSFGNADIVGEGDFTSDKFTGSVAFVGEGVFSGVHTPTYGADPPLHLLPYFVAIKVTDGSGAVIFNTVATVGSVTTPEWETPVAGGTPTSPSWDEEIG